MNLKTSERWSQNQMSTSQTLKTILRDPLSRDWDERLRIPKNPEDSTKQHHQPAECWHGTEDSLKALSDKIKNAPNKRGLPRQVKGARPVPRAGWKRDAQDLVP